MTTVLHCIDTWGPGGAETICAELITGLDRARYQSCAAVFHDGWLSQMLRTSGADVDFVPSSRGPVDWRYLFGLFSLARRRRASLIQTHLLTSALYGSFVARVLGIPIVSTFHGMVDVPTDDKRAGIKLRLIRANASRLVFVSEALRKFFAAAYPIAEERTAVIPNGIDATHFAPAPHRRLRAELGVADDTILIGVIGNVRAAKGYDDLLGVASILRQMQANVRFVVAGEQTEPLYGSIVNQQKTLGLESTVQFLGFRADIADLLNGVDIFASTSTSEGFSLTTIQAMASELPVVATRSGGPDEIVTNGVDGILVPVGDAEAMAREIATLVSQTQERRRLGAAGRETVLRRFTIERMIARYESLYDGLIAQA